MRRLCTFCWLLILPIALIADNWMSRLNDNVYVSQLSIPGTHDSGTGNGGQNAYLIISFDRYARTQDKNLSEQLALGIRALDLRPNNQLDIYHGIMKTNTTLESSLDVVRDFLIANPTEFVFIIMRHEDDGDSGSADWATNVNNLLNNSKYAPYVADFYPDLTVGDMRGKMLIFSRKDYASTPVGAFIHNWGYDSNFANQQGATVIGKSEQARIFIQDYYDCTGDGGATTKTNSIKAMLDYSTGRATASDDEHVWVVNHTSGYSSVTEIFGYTIATSNSYRENAATQNAAVIDYLSSKHGPTGFVMMDFAGVDTSESYDVKGLSLTNAIIENNFQYTPKTADESSGILQEMINQVQDNDVYDLQGHRVQAERLQKGIYIVGGKKVVVAP